MVCVLWAELGDCPGTCSQLVSASRFSKGPLKMRVRQELTLFSDKKLFILGNSPPGLVAELLLLL